MPVQNYQSPEEKPLELLPPNYYHVKIEDIEGEVKDFGFTNEDGTKQPPTHQFIIRLLVIGPPEYAGRKLTTWVRDSLFPQNKTKGPTLPKLLKAISGQNYTVADRARVNADFMNSLIGSELRVATANEEDKKGQERTKVISISPLVKAPGSVGTSDLPPTPAPVEDPLA